MQTAQYGKGMKPQGTAPAIVLCRPKYAHNVGAAVRAAACFGVNQVWFTGDRVSLDPAKGQRLPREERMKGYKSVELRQHDYPFEQFPGATPVAVELRQGSELLTSFEHPENPVYVFGPEDGSLDKVETRHCHRFVVIPTRHCTNLAAAVYLLLYDRLLKRHQAGIEEVWDMDQILAEPRGWMLPETDGLVV
jgi:tRNA(Leu) C34 or U34 (ribose-2'-O)-methylase TrmL